MTIRVSAIAAFESNYIWLIHNDEVGFLVDPGCFESSQRALTEHGLTLAGILLTHHHHDHIGGVDEFLMETAVPVWGPKDDRTPQVNVPLVDGDQIELPHIHLPLQVIATPGHTRSHIAFVNSTMIFAGDTLFSVGCGRLFEGTPAQMLASLDRLAQCSPDALVYCGHEYTEANIAFALAVEPNNPALLEKSQDVAKLRQQGRPTLPVTLASELATNPFLRTREPSVWLATKQHDSRCGSTASEVFATLRSWKDTF